MGSIKKETAVWTHYKILTHEVGHWANLKHTWGDQSYNQASEGCTFDDGVEDTPNTIGNTEFLQNLLLVAHKITFRIIWIILIVHPCLLKVKKLEPSCNELKCWWTKQYLVSFKP